MPDRHLTLACEDVAAGATFFRDVLSLPVRQHDRDRADVDLGTGTATLTTGTDARPGPATIVMVEVEDLVATVHDLHRRGATVLIDPVLTEWGTESAFVEGPDGLVVELYRERFPRR